MKRRILIFFLFGFFTYSSVAQSLGEYQNFTILKVGGNEVIKPLTAPIGISKSSVRVNGNFQGEVLIEPTSGDIHINNAYPNGNYKVDVFAPNGLSTSFTLTVNGTECKSGSRYLFSREIFDISSKFSKVADVNADGLSDILLTSSTTNGGTNIILLLNSLAGFIRAPEIPIGFMPEVIDLGDLNNDGIIDIVATEFQGSRVSILYGTGAGRYEQPLNLTVTANINNETFTLTLPRTIKISDINIDGYSDLITLSPSQGILYIGLGSASGSFDFDRSISLGSFGGPSESGALEVANVISDFYPEILAEINGIISIVNLSQGDVRIVNQINVQFNGSGLTVLKVFDLNADNNLDIFFSETGNGSIMLLGDGTGLFATDVTNALNLSDGTYFEILDLNGDKYVDIFQCTSNNPFFGTSILTGSLNAPDFLETIPIGDFSALSILDINRDQILDVVVSDNNFGTTSILYGTADYFKEKASNSGYTIAGEIGRVVAFEATGDEYQDFVVSDRLSPVFYLSAGNSGGGYDLISSFSNPFETGGIRTLDVGDFDNDGAKDIAVGYGSGYIYFYRNTGQGGFQLMLNNGTPVTIQLNTQLKRLKVIDYNSDGRQDLIAFDESSIYLMLGNSDFSFTTVISNSLTYNFGDITGFETKDLNGDKILDIIISDASLDVVALYSGNSTGDFRLENTLSIAGVYGFAIGDYNKDGSIDLVLAVPQTGLVLFIGNALFDFFRDKTLYTTDPYFFDGNDLNGDGEEDFIFIDNTDLIKILLFDKPTSQILEQVTTLATQGAPGGPGNMYFGDFGSIYGAMPDGNVDIFVGWNDAWIDGFKPILINQTLKKKITVNGSLVEEVIRCNQSDVSFSIKPEGVQGFQWEYATDNINFTNYINQNSNLLSYNLDFPLVYLRAKLTNADFCTVESSFYSQTIKVQTSELPRFNLLQDLYSSCDSVVNISVPSIFKTFKWSNGSNLNSVQLKNSGQINLKVTDSLNCSLIDTALIEISPLRIINSDTIICKGTYLTLSLDSTLLKQNLYKKDLLDGLIFYASFDENTNDFTSNFVQKNDINISYDTDRHGNPFKAALFTESSSVVYDYVPVINQNSYTISAWMYIEKTGSVINLQRIGFFLNPTFSDSFNIETSLNNGIDYPWILQYGKWHHVVVTFDSANSVHSLFVNGVLFENRIVSRLFDSGIGPLKIGGGIIGKLDDIAVWNRVLSDYEISVLSSNNYLVKWSNGAIGNSIKVNPTITSKYFATYTLGSTICTDSVQVVVSDIDTSLTLSGSSIKCFGDSITLTVVPGQSYEWYKNDTLILSEISNVYKTLDTGVYRVLIKDIYGCSDTSSRIEIRNVRISSGFSINDTVQGLSSNSFVFSNLSNASGGAVLKYDWDFGDGTSSNLESPTHVYDSIGTYRVKLRVLSDQGCVDSSFSDVTIHLDLKVGFRVNDSIQCLSGNRFVFTDTSTGIVGSVSYLWDFGDGGSSSLISSEYSYSKPGSYEVKLLIIDSFGSRDSSTVRVRVDSISVVSFRINDTLQCLSGNSFIFSNKTILPSGDNYSYKWDFGDGGTSALSSPSYVYGLSGLYNVRLIGTSLSGCSDTSVVGVEVYGMPVAEFSVNDTIQCLSGNVFQFSNLTKTSSSEQIEYNWNFGDSKTSSLFSVSHTYQSQGKYTVQLVALTTNGCSDSAYKDVTVFSLNDIKLSINDTLQCVSNNKFLFSDSTIVPSEIKFERLWNFGDGTTSALINPVHSYTTAAKFKVKLRLSLSIGCSDSTQKIIEVVPQPLNKHYNTVNATINRSILVQARDSGISYLWSPSIGLNATNKRNPEATLSKDQKYIVKVETQTNCLVYDTLIVRVFKNYDIYVPQGFTPNYDGNNDRLYPILVGIQKLSIFKVFDRWGNMIYNRADVNNSNGWDGTFNGKGMPAGVYVWIAEGIDLDNNLIRRQGNIALIR